MLKLSLRQSTRKTRVIKSVQKGLLSFLIQPFYLALMLALPETVAEESLLGYLLVYLFMLPLLPGFMVAALVSGENIHSNEMLIAIPAGLAVNSLLHSTCIYAILYFKETFRNRSTPGSE